VGQFIELNKVGDSKKTNFTKQANQSLPIAYNKILRMFVITLIFKFKEKEIKKSEAQLS